MLTIYYLLFACILAVGVFLAGVYWRQIVTRYQRYRRKLQRNTLPARVEQLEMRVELHTKKDKVYLDKFDDMEEQIQTMAKTLSKREVSRKHNLRRDVREYLKDLQNG